MLNLIILSFTILINDTDIIILIRLWTWHIKFEKRKEFKKNKREEFKKYI